MITSEPAVSVSPLSAVTPGSLVLYEGEFGFVTFNSEHPDAHTFVLHKPATQTFVYTPLNADAVQVFNFGQNLVLQPNLLSVQEGQLLNRDTGSALFIVGSDHHIIAQVGNGDYRWVRLATGAMLVNRAATLTPVIREWSIGVRDASGRYIALIEASSRIAAALNQGPIGPDVL